MQQVPLHVAKYYRRGAVYEYEIYKAGGRLCIWMKALGDFNGNRLASVTRGQVLAPTYMTDMREGWGSME